MRPSRSPVPSMDKYRVARRSNPGPALEKRGQAPSQTQQNRARRQLASAAELRGFKEFTESASPARMAFERNQTTNRAPLAEATRNDISVIRHQMFDRRFELDRAPLDPFGASREQKSDAYFLAHRILESHPDFAQVFNQALRDSSRQKLEPNQVNLLSVQALPERKQI